MSKISTSAFWIAALSAVWLGGEAGYAIARGPAVKLEDVLRAARERQERVHSLHFRWKMLTTYGKGSRTLPPAYNPTGEVIPPHDVTYESTSELWLDGEKMRYLQDYYQWSREKQTMLPWPMLGVNDGKTTKELQEHGTEDKPYPMGWVRAEKRYWMAMSVEGYPLFMTFRACEPRLAVLDLSQMTLTGRQAPIDGHLCCELQLKHPGTADLDHLWVDPSRDFAISRHLQTANGKVVSQTDVRFTNDPMAGWVPSAWDVVARFPDGKLQLSEQAQVLEHQINPALDADLFDIVFPRGTVVNDQPENKLYIIKPDGSERVWEKEEWGLSYQEALASEPGELVGTQCPFWVRWWGRLALMGAGIVLVGYWCFRYKKYRVRSAPRRSGDADTIVRV
jgi:hypothetical protein